MTTALQRLGRPGNLGRVTVGYKQLDTANHRRTVTRPRLDLSDKDKDLGSRFARRLRKLMEDRGWTSREVAELVTAGGVAVGDRAVDAWLRGCCSCRKASGYRVLLVEPWASTTTATCSPSLSANPKVSRRNLSFFKIPIRYTGFLLATLVTKCYIQSVTNESVVRIHRRCCCTGDLTR